MRGSEGGEALRRHRVGGGEQRIVIAGCQARRDRVQDWTAPGVQEGRSQLARQGACPKAGTREPSGVDRARKAEGRQKGEGRRVLLGSSLSQRGKLKTNKVGPRGPSESFEKISEKSDGVPPVVEKNFKKE